MTEMEILYEIVEKYKKVLGNNLAGVYVHGSIAFHCFHWDKSDIDFLAVVSHAPSLPEKEALITALLELDAECPPKGLEMSVVLENVCSSFQYPVPFELHFSNAHKERCKTDLYNYCLTMNGADKDLAAHFTVIRKAGIRLYGKEISRVFDAVPKSDYIDSIKGDIDDAVLSKEQGGIWGIKNLPPAYHTIIENAVRCYRGNDIYENDRETEKRFAEYMVREIFSE